jgi:HPt (histidine-containing phosphotransfer) domain-containing protein
MTIQECYKAMGGDYDDAISRLRKEESLKKFARLFLKDTSFAQLTESLKSGDYETAFRMAHTLKGTTSNLSFQKLAASSTELTELLRGGVKPGAEAKYEQVAADYAMTVEAIGKLDD